MRYSKSCLFSDSLSEVLGEVRRIIEDARRDALTIGVPSEEEKWNKLDTLKLYRCLPKTNCGECGEATCIALAVKVLSGERRLSECPLLKRKEYSHLIEGFREEYGDRILRTLGWS